MIPALPIPVIETERLILRAPVAKDLAPYAAFCATPRSQFVGGPMDEIDAWKNLCAVAGQWVIRGYGRWVVTTKGDDTALGLVGLHHPADWPEAEIGWTLFEGAEGKGYAAEAAHAARFYAYEHLGWPGIVSLIAPENLRSIALGRKMGAQLDGVFAHPKFGPLEIWRHPGPTSIGENRQQPDTPIINLRRPA
ncbi:MAG: GNAT family N-acetyltransferase [Qingshengfaniella sp.]